MITQKHEILFHYLFFYYNFNSVLFAFKQFVDISNISVITHFFLYNTNDQDNVEEMCLLIKGGDQIIMEANLT